MVSLTRRVRFRATHQLRLAALDDDANRARFGWTTDPHPHDYTCDVTVSGSLPADGALVDLAEFDRLLDRGIVTPLDGRHLNDLVPEWARGEALPTCEALAAWCWHQLVPSLPGSLRLDHIRVAEDDSLWSEYRNRE